MHRGVQSAQLIIGAISTAIIITGVLYSGAREPSPQPIPHVPTSSTVQIPAVFVPNDGRLDSRVRFYARGAHHAIFATDQGVMLAFEPSADRKLALRLEFVGAGSNTKVTSSGPAPTHINYFNGAKPTVRRTNVLAFREVVYRDVWRAIDASVLVHPDRLKYQFRVNPGGDPSSIRLRYDGATRLHIDENGELEIDTPSGTIVDAAPRSFQSIDGRQVPVSSHFVLLADAEYGIDVGDYDVTQPLVIDPAIMYASYLGSSGADEGHAIAVDASVQPRMRPSPPGPLGGDHTIVPK